MVAYGCADTVGTVHQMHESGMHGTGKMQELCLLHLVHRPASHPISSKTVLLDSLRSVQFNITSLHKPRGFTVSLLVIFQSRLSGSLCI